MIKLKLLTSVFVLLSFSIFAKEIRLSEPVHQTESSETFGAMHNDALPKLSLSELLSDPAKYESKTFQLETEIAKVCQKKGCFFIARENQHAVRISFKDYGFFIPTGSKDKLALLAGELVQRELSEKQAEHFNKDLKTAASIKAGLVYEIVAESVTIPKS